MLDARRSLLVNRPSSLVTNIWYVAYPSETSKRPQQTPCLTQPYRLSSGHSWLSLLSLPVIVKAGVAVLSFQRPSLRTRRFSARAQTCTTADMAHPSTTASRLGRLHLPVFNFPAMLAVSLDASDAFNAQRIPLATQMFDELIILLIAFVAIVRFVICWHGSVLPNGSFSEQIAEVIYGRKNRAISADSGFEFFE